MSILETLQIISRTILNQTMNIKTFLLICCTAFVTGVVQAKTPQKKVTAAKVTAAHAELMDRRVNELMADRVGFKKELTTQELAVSKEEEAELIAEEELMFPADELYESNSENQWVDPFRGKTKIHLPDSFTINCASFVYPIAIDSMARVSSKFGPRRRRMHKGIDLKVLKGDTIRAAFAGKVRIKSYERRGYGYYVVIRHPNGLETVYGHLSKILVDANQIVRAGETIGLGGNTGRSTGSHLHFETRFLGQAINPAEIIDFENGVPHQDEYVFRNVKIRGRRSNIYTSSSDQMVYHRVKSGDTLGKIARMYGTTVAELCRLNGLKATSILRLGQSIRCSAGAEAKATKSTNKQQTQPKSTAVSTKKIVVAADASAEASLDADSKPVYHRIQSGDTLSAIATRYGTTVEKLCELNGISRTTILKLGRSIRCS